jgi:hypothetical protein
VGREEIRAGSQRGWPSPSLPPSLPLACPPSLPSCLPACCPVRSLPPCLLPGLQIHAGANRRFETVDRFCGCYNMRVFLRPPHDAIPAARAGGWERAEGGREGRRRHLRQKSVARHGRVAHVLLVPHKRIPVSTQRWEIHKSPSAYEISVPTTGPSSSSISTDDSISMRTAEA